jgi:ribose transport system permease protein
MADGRALGKRKGFILQTHHILAVSLVVLGALFSTLSRDFYSAYNLVSMLTNMSFLGLSAMGFCVNLIGGEVDISIGANIALTSVVTAYCFEAGLPIAVCILAGLMVGVVMGSVNGIVIAGFKANSLIVTLGTMSIAQGVAYTMTGGLAILVMEDVLGFFGRGKIGPVPFPIVVLVIFTLLFTALVNFTKFGRRVQAVGSNASVAFLSGIRVKRVKFAGLMICGVMTSISGLMMASMSAVGMPQHSIGQEFPIISAVILGGASLSGGKGSVAGSIIGILIISLIYNGLTMLNIPSYTVEMIRGLILILIVASYEVKDRKRK